MITVLSVIIAIIITAIICYFLPKGKIQEANDKLEKEKQQLQLDIKDAEKEWSDLANKFIQEQQRQDQILREDMRKWEQEKSNKNLSFLKAEMTLKENIAGLESEIEEKKKSINILEEQTTEAVKSIEAKVYDLMSTEFAQKANLEIDHCRYLSAQAQAEYEKMMQELIDMYSSKNEEQLAIYNKIVEDLNEAQKKTNSIIEANRRSELEKEKKDFYRLQLSDIDIEEIKKIRSIEPYLRKKEPLNKVIWKVYYEKPFTDLIGRIIGPGIKCGIYKITNLENGMVYIGQSNNITERWRQHIKRGVGADPPTQNKLYPAMLEFGAENFTFEIVEECPPDKLTEREKYYTDIFQANSYGYVVRKG